MKVCPSCGYKDQAAFCKHCGAQMVSEERAEFLQTPGYTGITVPPPTATEGRKVSELTPGEDFDEIGFDSEGSSSWGGVGIVVLIVVVVAVWVVARVTGANP